VDDGQNRRAGDGLGIADGQASPQTFDFRHASIIPPYWLAWLSCISSRSISSVCPAACPFWETGCNPSPVVGRGPQSRAWGSKSGHCWGWLRWDSICNCSVPTRQLRARNIWPFPFVVVFEQVGGYQPVKSYILLCGCVCCVTVFCQVELSWWWWCWCGVVGVGGVVLSGVLEQSGWILSSFAPSPMLGSGPTIGRPEHISGNL